MFADDTTVKNSDEQPTDPLASQGLLNVTK